MLTDDDLKKLAELIRPQPHDNCPLGLDSDTVAVIKELADAIRSGKKTVRKTLLALLTTALVGLVVAGLVERIRAWIR